MLFSRDDFRIDSVPDLIEFLPIFIFLGVVAPFVVACYTVGFLMDITGWLNTGT